MWDQTLSESGLMVRLLGQQVASLLHSVLETVASARCLALRIGVLTVGWQVDDDVAVLQLIVGVATIHRLCGALLALIGRILCSVRGSRDTIVVDHARVGTRSRPRSARDQAARVDTSATLMVSVPLGSSLLCQTAIELCSLLHGAASRTNGLLPRPARHHLLLRARAIVVRVLGASVVTHHKATCSRLLTHIAEVGRLISPFVGQLLGLVVGARAYSRRVLLTSMLRLRVGLVAQVLLYLGLASLLNRTG